VAACDGDSYDAGKNLDPSLCLGWHVLFWAALYL